MVTEWQAFCLSSLGIQRWVLRQDMPTVAIYLGPDTPFPLSAQASSLLRALLAYKGLSLADVHLVSTLASLHAYTNIWLLGHDGPLPVGLDDGRVTVNTKSLQQMLNVPKIKKDVFQSLG